MVNDSWKKYWDDHPEKYRKMVRQFNWAITAYLVLIVVLFVVTVLLVMEFT